MSEIITTRMSAEERRAAIVQAAMPLFARNGFASTTTKELAEVAGVSEALIYKHFPSKESLYAEIQKCGCRGCDPMLQKLTALKPSTSTLVYIIYYLVRANLLGAGKNPATWQMRHRMVLNSCLEDGSFARMLFHNRFVENMSPIEACMAAAEEAGDVVLCTVRRRNRLIFTHHLAVMVATMHLPEQAVVDYEISKEELLHETMLFCLRGIGLSDTAIARYYDPKALALFFGQNES